MLAYRLISQDSILKHRSFCPHCKNTIAWYDLIPLLSWVILKGKCRSCSASISWLYFFIELLSVICFSALAALQQPYYWLTHFIFFSALLITIRTDLEHMLISRYVTLFLIPLGLLLSFMGFLPITFFESIMGAFSAYFFLYLISSCFFFLTKKVGLGQGDIELLAFIGSFLGIVGWWVTLIIGSFLGSILGILYILFFQKNSSVKIPFGPFLAFGALVYVLCENELLTIFFY
jgi:leader peptidase (prepilin peptidase) / N-methyltransferase